MQVKPTTNIWKANGPETPRQPPDPIEPDPAPPPDPRDPPPFPRYEDVPPTRPTDRADAGGWVS